MYDYERRKSNYGRQYYNSDRRSSVRTATVFDTRSGSTRDTSARGTRSVSTRDTLARDVRSDSARNTSIRERRNVSTTPTSSREVSRTTTRLRSVRHQSELEDRFGPDRRPRNQRPAKRRLSKKTRRIRKIKRAIRRFALVGAIVVLAVIVLSFVIRGVSKDTADIEFNSENNLQVASMNISSKDINLENIPESLQKMLTNVPEAADFVYNYEKNAGKKQDIDISSEVKKGEVPSFIQWDERWGYLTFDDDFFAVNGCGPTCLSMVYCAVTGNSDIDPYKMSQVVIDVGSKTKGGGTEWSAMTKVPAKLGFIGREVIFDRDHILEELDKGHPIICNVGPGDFTKTGHYIVLCGFNNDGTIEVHDPNSIEKTNKSWDIETIMAQAKNMWSFRLK